MKTVEQHVIAPRTDMLFADSIFDFIKFGEQIANTVIDVRRARENGETVSALRINKAFLGGERICPKPSLEIDERISKLNDVQTYLSDAIDAVEDLKTQANRNKEINQRLLSDLSILRENQQRAKADAKAITDATQADIDAFRKLAGVPSKEEIRRGQVISFWSGVVASLFAAGIWWCGAKMLEYVLGGS